jgi:hypothetical protein
MSKWPRRCDRSETRAIKFGEKLKKYRAELAWRDLEVIGRVASAEMFTAGSQSHDPHPG